MSNINRILILTIILSFVILIGAGEEKIFIGWIEFLAPSQFIKGYSKFSLTGTSDDKAFSSSLIMLMGQIILLIACFAKRYSFKITLAYSGLSLLIFSFIFLAFTFSKFDHYIFWSGIPFLLSAIFLLIITVKKYSVGS
jgi:hypothetical protein